ncbi:restriction endonuclease subunit S [Candidatus Parcubacteria bacterium]|nr:restriction endonuclease subunit S [Candidatus Parcubacteria bacterium]
MKSVKQKSNWQIKKLGEVCDVLDSKRQPITKRDRVAGEYPYYGATGILDYVQDYIFDEKLILIGEDGAKWGAGENTAFIADGKYWVNNHAHVIRPHRDIVLDNWMIYFFFLVDLTKFTTGLTVPKLNQENLKKIEIPIPPPSEQHRIVKILDEVFEKTAKAKENAGKNLQNAKKLFESYLQGVFANSGKNWEEKGLEELGQITSSKRIYKKEYVKDGIPFYRIKEIKELAHDKNITLKLYISKKRYKEMKDIFGVPLVGDILMTAVGTIGEIYVVKNNEEFYFKDGNILWFKNFNSVDPYFLKFVLISFVEQINKLSKGSAYSALTIEKIEKHRIFLPKLAEQKQIVKKLDSLSEQTKKLEKIYQQKIDDLAELKKSVLRKAFNGGL